MDRRVPERRRLSQRRSMMIKTHYTTVRTVTVAALPLASAAMVAGFALSNALGRVEAQSLPASKAAVAIDSLIDLSQVANGPPNSAGDTDWVDVLRTQIKTSSQKDL